MKPWYFTYLRTNDLTGKWFVGSMTIKAHTEEEAIAKGKKKLLEREEKNTLKRSYSYKFQYCRDY